MRRLLRIALALWPTVIAGQSSVKRVLRPAAWRVDTLVAADVNGTFGRPTLLAVSSELVVMYDYADAALRAVDLRGADRWRFGRAGRGPWEFENPTDLKMDVEGNVWVLDAPARRITIVSAAGKGRRMIQLRAGIERFGILKSGGFWGVPLEGRASLVGEFDSTGTVVKRISLPAWLDSTSRMSTDMRTTVSADGTHRVVGMYYSGELFDIDPSGTVREIQNVQPGIRPKSIQRTMGGTTATRLDPKTVASFRSISSDERRLYVLSSDVREEQRGVLVDRYDLRTGKYESSEMLPLAATRIAATSQGYIVINLDSLPAVYSVSRKSR